MCTGGAKNNSHEDVVVENPLKYVSLPVTLPRINFVKYLHPNKGVKENSAMRGWFVFKTRIIGSFAEREELFPLEQD